MAGWLTVLPISTIGPLVVGSEGPYFYRVGTSCSISPKYVLTRVFTEYLFAFIAVTLGLTLSTLVLLRLRRNVKKGQNQAWQFYVVTTNENEKDRRLDFSGNLTSTSTANSANIIAQKLILYPTSYAIIVFPITIVHILESSNTNRVPFVIETLATVLFNLLGLVNVIIALHVLRNASGSGSSVLPTVLSKLKPLSIIPIGKFPENEKHNQSQAGRSPASLLDSDWTRSPAQTVAVDLPTKPGCTYVAPDSWKTTASRGRIY